MTHPDPETSVATALQELGDLYAFNWPNVYGRRATDDLAKACDEVVKWVREVKGEILPKASRESA